MIAMLALVALAQTTGIERVAWLQGCWESVTPQRSVEEQWTAPRGGTMLGAGRTVRGGKTVVHEFVLLREQGAQLAYEAHPGGQASTVFVSREVGPATVVFENLQHDFPQRVGYRREGRETLKAWIEGDSGGKLQRIEFDYRAVACPGG